MSENTECGWEGILQVVLLYSCHLTEDQRLFCQKLSDTLLCPYSVLLLLVLLLPFPFFWEMAWRNRSPEVFGALVEWIVHVGGGRVGLLGIWGSGAHQK